MATITYNYQQLCSRLSSTDHNNLSCMRHSLTEQVNRDMAQSKQNELLESQGQQFSITHLSIGSEMLVTALKATIQKIQHQCSSKDSHKSIFGASTPVTRSLPLAKPDVDVIHHKIISTSVSSSDFARWKSNLHLSPIIPPTPQSLCQPPNPILPNGEKRFNFSIYQMTLSTAAHIKILDQFVQWQEYSTYSRQTRANEVIVWRLLKRVGLREWEWTCGEPTHSDTTSDSITGEDSSDNSAPESSSRKLRPRSGCSTNTKTQHSTPPPQTYAQRVENFTYTYGDDPLFRGRKMNFTSRRELIALKGDYSNEISPEDKAYVLPAQHSSHHKASDQHKSHTERQDITAGDYILGGGTNRQLEKQAGGIDTREGQRFAKRSISVDSGCSAISDASEE